MRRTISRRGAFGVLGGLAMAGTIRADGTSPPGLAVAEPPTAAAPDELPILTLIGNPALCSLAEKRLGPELLRRVRVRRWTWSDPRALALRIGRAGMAPGVVHAHLESGGRVAFSRDLGIRPGSTLGDLGFAIMEASAPDRIRPVGGPEDDLPPGFDKPDERGEVWTGFTYAGKTVQCPVPRSLRKRNEGGSDGAGLCVIASQVCDGNWQELVREVADMWTAAKRRPGGYHPERLKRLVAELHPEIKYLSYEGKETDWLKPWLDYGVPVGVTYGTGRGYRYQPIAHMVSLVGIWEDYAAIIDNNFPRWVAWMPRAEFNRRFVMSGGYGWGFLWRKLMRDDDGGGTQDAALSVAAGLGALAFGGMALAASPVAAVVAAQSLAGE